MSDALDLAAALQRSVRGSQLSRGEAREVFANAVSGSVDPVQLGGLLASMATRGESAAEIAGAVDALRAAMVPFEHAHSDAIDTCGTGGDGLGLVNLSTAAAVVAAAAGAHVVKHGNRALSSQCGSADVLEAAGVRVELSPRAARDVLDEVGITFLFAPLYHPALRAAAPVRRSLGVRTIFNLLGPLLNPGRVRRQLLGVGDPARVEQFAAVLRDLGHERVLVVHGAGGADELTLAGENAVAAIGFERAPGLDALHAGLASAPIESLRGGDKVRNVAAIRAALSGELGPIADAIALNAAAALLVAGVERELAPALARAKESLANRSALERLERWASLSQRVEGAR